MSSKVLYYDTTYNRFCDSNGDIAQLPVLFFANLTNWTINFKTNSGEIGGLANDTRFASLSAFSMSVDNDYIHELRGSLNAGYSGAVTSIVIDNIEVAPPETGTIVLQNGASETEEISYTAASSTGTNQYTFTVSETLSYTYLALDSADVKEELMVLVSNSNINSAGKGTGTFVITIDTETRGYLLATLDKSEAVSPVFEFVGLDGSANRGETMQTGIVCKNIINYDGTAEPTDGHYTNAQIDALVTTKQNLDVTFAKTTSTLTAGSGRQIILVTGTSTITLFTAELCNR